PAQAAAALACGSASCPSPFRSRAGRLSTSRTEMEEDPLLPVFLTISLQPCRSVSWWIRPRDIRSERMAVAPQRIAPSIEQLYRQDAQELRAYAYELRGNSQDAEDLVQAAFLNAHRALDRGQVPHMPRLWLRRIAENLWRERLRAQSRRPPEVPFPADLP